MEVEGAEHSESDSNVDQTSQTVGNTNTVLSQTSNSEVQVSVALVMY